MLLLPDHHFLSIHNIDTGLRNAFHATALQVIDNLRSIALCVDVTDARERSIDGIGFHEGNIDCAVRRLDAAWVFQILTVVGVTESTLWNLEGVGPTQA